jgi:imidazolonepropionase-like amidohydrolase
MRFCFCAAISLAALSLSAANAQNAPDIFAITNARIYIGKGKTIEHGSLVFRDGIITAVGEKVAVPSDATIIDGTNCTLYSGLIDGYSHLGMPQATDYPAPRGDTYRITKVRAENTASALFTPDTTALETRRKLGFGAALIAPGVGIFTGTSALISLGTGSGAASQIIASPVAMHVDWTAPDVGRSYPASLMGKIAATRQALYDAQSAATLLDAYARSPQGRPRPVVPRSIAAIIPVIQGKTTLIFHADSAQNIRRVLTICREFKLRPVIEGGLEAYRVADELKAENATVLLSLNLPQPPPLPRKGADDNTAFENTLQLLRYRANVPRTAATLAKVGVPFALTTAGMESPASAPQNVRRLIAAGLSEDQAIDAFTETPARIFGVERQMGTLETGKIANVIVVSGGTLFDGKGKLRHVFVDGHPVELDADKAPPGAKPLANIPLSPGVTVEMATVALENRGSGGESSSQKTEGSAVAAPPETGTGPVPPLPPALPTAFVLRGATVWTSSAVGTLSTADIYVRDGKIVKVGSDLKVPAGTREISAVGKHITPGIIDCHSHTAIEGGVNEGTNSITSECRIEDVIDADDVNIYRELAGGTTAANVLHGSANAIGGQNAVVKWRWGKTPEEMLIKGAFPGIKFALGENPKQSNFSLPGRPRRYPTTRLGVEKVSVMPSSMPGTTRKNWLLIRRGGFPLHQRVTFRPKPSWNC